MCGATFYPNLIIFKTYEARLKRRDMLGPRLGGDHVASKDGLVF